METIRKCHECHEKIILEKDPFILDKEIYRHYDCFIKYLLNKKRNKVNKDEAIKIADSKKEESRLLVKSIIAKNHLYQWIQRSYNIVTLPSCFFTKMDAVFNGTYKGMAIGIPPEDLLDMWERKWKDLCNTYAWNIAKGKIIDDVGRINYDLAIILSKSTSYYKWKEKQKKNNLESETKLSGFNFETISKNTTEKTTDDYDLSDILEEI